MLEVESLRALLIEQLSEIYDGEKRLTRAIAALADVATDPELQAALDEHANETETHVLRIEEMFEELDMLARTKTCAGMQTLIAEGADHVKELFGSDELRDAAIIGAAQHVEHYEIAAYGTAAAHARLLELQRVTVLLELTLNEEKVMDRTLTEIAQSIVNPGAAETAVGRDESERALAGRRRG